MMVRKSNSIPSSNGRGRFLSIAWKMAAGFALSFVTFIVVGAVAYLGLARYSSTNYWVDHTYEVITAQETLLSHLKDAETGKRGFLLTGVEAYLEPYTSAVEQLEKRAPWSAKRLARER